MAYSKISYIGDGSTTSYTTPSYIEKSHIAVWVDGNLSFEHSWTGPNTITFNTAPASGAVIEIVRNSSQQTRLVNYQQPSPLDAETLNRDSKQAFYMAQEALDEASLALHRTPDGDSYDAEGNPIVNVGSPTNGADAATKSYVDITVASGVPGGPITLFTVADYAELRGLTAAAYAANRVFVTNPAPGEFWHDAADTTSADDGGVIIVDADGRRWKRLESYAGYVCPTWWGAKPGGDPTDNHTAIQECFNKYMGAGKTIHKILFTKKGEYKVNATLNIALQGFAQFPFNLDLGDCIIRTDVPNIPLIEFLGSSVSLWKICNGQLWHTATGDSNAMCLSFASAPNDGVTNNGPHNGVIERVFFKGGYTSIGVGIRDFDPEDAGFTIWDVRIEKCYFSNFANKAIHIQDNPAFTITAKNITIRSCYIVDNYKSGLSTTPIMYFRNVMLLSIDDLEVIQTIRPVLRCFSVTADIRSLSIENPGSGSPALPSDCPYLMAFTKSAVTIHSLNVMTLRSDVGAGNRMPLIYTESDQWNTLPVTVGMVDLFRLESVTGGFCLFGGNEYARIVHTSPPIYHETTPSTCSLFEYDSTKANNVVANRTILAYLTRRVRTETITSGTYNWNVDDIHNCISFLNDLTGNLNVNVLPNNTATSMANYAQAGHGATLRVTRRGLGAFALTVSWGGGSVTIPANSRGTIEIAWHSVNGWELIDYGTW